MFSYDSRVMLRWQQEMQSPGKLKQWWQQLTILTCLDFQKPSLALNMQLRRMMLINKSMSVEMMTKNTMRSMLSAILEAVTSWKNQHTQWVL